MKKLIYFFVLLLVALPSLAQTTNQEATAQNGNKMLLGVCNRAGLTKDTYKPWFDNSYNTYTPDSTTLAGAGRALKGVKVVAFMGTWCGDSKREVPRFYKIMDHLKAGEKNIQLICVGNEGELYKKSPTGEEKDLKITNVPTFIFYRKGQEIGRIVESPVESLEKDMVKILTGVKYTPNYSGQ